MAVSLKQFLQLHLHELNVDFHIQGILIAELWKEGCYEFAMQESLENNFSYFWSHFSLGEKVNVKGFTEPMSLTGCLHNNLLKENHLSTTFHLSLTTKLMLSETFFSPCSSNSVWNHNLHLLAHFTYMNVEIICYMTLEHCKNNIIMRNELTN